MGDITKTHDVWAAIKPVGKRYRKVQQSILAAGQFSTGPAGLIRQFRLNFLSPTFSKPCHHPSHLENRMTNRDNPTEQGQKHPEPDDPDVTMVDAGEGGPGEDPDYDEAGEGDDGVDDRH